ncbi:MAG: T9SS type A sorting domain-containing protein [Reichenbachiella sp.]
MKQKLLISLFAMIAIFNEGYAQDCVTPVQNIIEDFNTIPDPNNRAVLTDCWTLLGGGAQMDSGGLLLALLGSTSPGIVATPTVENGEGVVTFRARKTSSYVVYLSVGIYSGGNFIEAATYTLGSSFVTYTYDFANFASKTSSATNIAFRITSGPNSGVQRLLLEDIEYKSFCLPAAVPTAIAKDITVQLDDTGNVIANPSLVDNGSTDDCGEFITNFSLDKTLFTCDDLGVNNVTMTATDSEGQTATATAVITVEPSFVFNSNQLGVDENGEVNVELSFLTNSKTECDAVTYALDQSRFTCSDAGYVTLTVTASYGGLTSTFSAAKNIRDYINPVATVQNIAVNIDESTGLAIITPEMIDDGSTDNCGIASFSLSKTSFDCADQGENLVIMTVTDDAGLSSTALAVVTVGSFVEDVVLSTNSATVCFDGSNENSGATIETDGSIIGTQYYLRNDADSLVVDGPLEGTGSGLSFTTGAISENTTFHVYGEIPFSGKALDLSANSAHLSVNTPGGFDYSTGYTISAWVKLDGSWNSTYYNSIFYAGGATGSDIEVYEASNGVLTIVHNRGNAGTQSYYTIAGDVITNSTYVHFAVTYDGATSRVFVNGVQKGSAALLAPIFTASSEMTFGHMNSSSFPAAQTYDGSMDDIRVYDVALTSSDILADYDKCISGAEDDLVLYYDLESSSGSIYTDLVSSTSAQIKNGAISTDEGAISCTFTCNRIMTNKITIGDDQAPVATTQNISMVLPSTGVATITADMIDNGSTDNCSAALTYELDIASFGCDDIGDNIVTLTVTDAAGNSESSTATVSISSLLEDANVTVASNSICPDDEDGTTVSIDSSVEGLTYYLRNSADNSVIGEPESGTGNAIEFSTGNITENTTFNVLGTTGDISTPHALEFAKNNQYVAAGEDVDFMYNDGYTVEAWVNAPFATNTSHAILEYGTNAQSDLQIYVQGGGTGLLTIIHDRSGSAKTYFQYPTPPRNQWAHIAITFDGGTTGIKAYYDGVEQTAVTVFNPTGPLPKREGATLNIGRALTFGSSNDSYQGKMDEVRIWDVPRSEAEINDYSNTCLSGSEDGLVSYFKFNEGAGTSATDLSGGNDGVLTGMDENTDWVTDVAFECQACELQMSTEVVVTVGDDEVPTAVAKDITVVLDANGSATITAGDIDNGSSDNCTAMSSLTLALDVNTFGIDNLGTNTVTLTVTDASGNIGTATAVATVSDKNEQVVTFDAVSDKTFGDADFSFVATTDSSLPVVLSVVSGDISINNDMVSITGAGVAVIRISNDGDDTYAPLQEDVTFNIAKADQTLTVEVVADKSTEASPISIVATVDSELVLTYDVTGLATIVDNVITLDGTLGTVSVTVSQVGDDNYNEISETFTFEVLEKQSQAITFENIADVTYGNSGIALSASTGASLPVSFAVISGPATISGSSLSITGAGSVTVEATQVGNVDFVAAAPVQRSFVVNPAPLTFTAENKEITFGDELPTLTYTTSGFVLGEDESALPISIEMNTTVSETADVGSYMITLSLGAVSVLNYAITIEEGTLLINQAGQVITIEDIADQIPSDPAFDVVASVDSGLPLVYEVSGPATITGTTITLNGEGTVTLTVSQEGTVNYAAAFASTTFDVAQILGVGDVNMEVSLYPNPFTDELMINSKNIEQVKIFNLEGREVLVQKRVSETIDTNQLKAGTYIVKIYFDHKILTKKMIKQY